MREVELQTLSPKFTVLEPLVVVGLPTAALLALLYGFARNVAHLALPTVPVLLAAFVAILSVAVWYRLGLCGGTRYRFNSDGVTSTYDFGFQHRVEVSFDAVTEVRFHQSLLQRLLGLGTIVLVTSTLLRRSESFRDLFSGLVSDDDEGVGLRLADLERPHEILAAVQAAVAAASRPSLKVRSHG